MIKIFGSGTITIDLNFFDNLSLEYHGSGIINFNSLEVISKHDMMRQLAIVLFGSGTIYIGKRDCEAISININGSGNVIGNNTTTLSFDGSISGSGSIKNIFAFLYANGYINGSGNIYCSIKNNCRINKHVIGSGMVTFGNK